MIQNLTKHKLLLKPQQYRSLSAVMPSTYMAVDFSLDLLHVQCKMSLYNDLEEFEMWLQLEGMELPAFLVTLM